MTNRLGASIWQTVHAERRALIRDLERIPPTDWSVPSLCAGWDIHDVVAHLVDSAKTTRLGFIRRLVAAGFDFDRDNAIGISRERASEPARTLAEFRAVLARTSTPPVAEATRLVEVFVHGEDIRQPLGIGRDYPPDQVSTALGYQVKTSVTLGGGKQPATGWRLVATDTAFEHGEGPEVRGRAIALLLAISGRPMAADGLTGAGAQAFYAATTEASR